MTSQYWEAELQHQRQLMADLSNLRDFPVQTDETRQVIDFLSGQARGLMPVPPQKDGKLLLDFVGAWKSLDDPLVVNLIVVLPDDESNGQVWSDRIAPGDDEYAVPMQQLDLPNISLCDTEKFSPTWRAISLFSGGKGLIVSFADKEGIAKRKPLLDSFYDLLAGTRLEADLAHGLNPTVYERVVAREMDYLRCSTATGETGLIDLMLNYILVQPTAYDFDLALVFGPAASPAEQTAEMKLVWRDAYLRILAGQKDAKLDQSIFFGVDCGYLPLKVPSDPSTTPATPSMVKPDIEAGAFY